MMTIDGVEYRNLQEQVLQNQSDIRYLLEEGGTLNQFGIRVVGMTSNASELPVPRLYEGEYGDAYAVGTQPPYELYIFTRQVAGQTGSWWFNIGQFPVPSTVPGPIGPQGIEGEQGQRGSLWYSQSGAPTNTVGVKNNDQALDGNNGNVYQFLNNEWFYVGNIRGPQGQPGIQGLPGQTGAQGPVGPQGPQGPQGQFISILGELNNVNQLPMVDTVPRYAAYLIPEDNVNHIWLIVGEGTSANPLRWYDAGGFDGGSKVTVDGNLEPEVELGYIPKISVNYKKGEDTRVGFTTNNNESKVTFSGLQATGYNVNNEPIEGTSTIELPLGISDEIGYRVLRNELQYVLTPSFWEKVDEKVSNAGHQEVQINAPSTSTNGQLTKEQLDTLQSNAGAYLMFNNEVYRLQDTQHISGYLVYSHLGFENTTSKYMIKCITITVSTRGWVLTSREVVNDADYLKITGGTVTGKTQFNQLQLGSDSAIATPDYRSKFDNMTPGRYRTLVESSGKSNMIIFNGLISAAQLGFTDGDYGYVITTIPWVDSSGGPITQFVSYKRKLYVRYSINETEWGSFHNIITEDMFPQQKYTHYITISGSVSGYTYQAFTSIVTTSSREITSIVSLQQALLNLGNGKRIMCTGFRFNSSTHENFIGIFSDQPIGIDLIEFLKEDGTPIAAGSGLIITDMVV